jgi:hypothetical protein
MYKSSIDIFTVSQERNHLESVGKMKDFVANKLRSLKAQKAALSNRMYTYRLLTYLLSPHAIY